MPRRFRAPRPREHAKACSRSIFQDVCAGSRENRSGRLCQPFSTCRRRVVPLLCPSSPCADITAIGCNERPSHPDQWLAAPGIAPAPLLVGPAGNMRHPVRVLHPSPEGTAPQPSLDLQSQRHSVRRAVQRVHDKRSHEDCLDLASRQCREQLEPSRISPIQCWLGLCLCSHLPSQDAALPLPQRPGLLPRIAADPDRRYPGCSTASSQGCRLDQGPRLDSLQCSAGGSATRAARPDRGDDPGRGHCSDSFDEDVGNSRTPSLGSRPLCSLEFGTDNAPGLSALPVRCCQRHEKLEQQISKSTTLYS